MLPAGKRDRLIRIERAALAPRDVVGHRAQSWSLLAKVWAEKRPAGATERLAAAEVNAEISSVFKILWSEKVADLNPKDRLIEGGITYEIVGVVEIGRRVGLQITANARADK